MIPTLGRWLIFSTCLILTSCGDNPRHAAEKTLRQVGPAKLRHEAASFYKELFVTPAGQYFLPKPDQWPPTFQRLEPLQVRAYADGFSLSLEEGREGEQGLYVVPQGMDNVPRESRNARFEKIDDGIYWYWFTQ